MKNTTPLELMDSLVEARARKDIDSAVACYETDAAVVVEPGKSISGPQAIAGFTKQAMELPLEFGARQVVEGKDVALHYSQWKLSTTNAEGQTQVIQGCTTDLLRRQADGGWLLAIDNAWGSNIFGSRG